MSDDVLSDVVRILKVSRAYYGRFETERPWAVQVGAREVLSVYAVLAGECVLETPVSDPLLLHGGDVAALMTPTPHVLRSPRGGDRIYPETALDGNTRCQTASWPPPPAAVEPGGVRLVSGRIEYDDARGDYWTKMIPSVLVVREQTQTLPWLESTLEFIVDELDGNRPGGQSLAARLTELLLVQIMSAQLDSLDASAPGWLTSLGDPQIGRALTLLHSQPEKPWTVAALARQLGMSRSSFASHFVERVGEPPVHYLTRLRMEKAATLLRAGRAATAEVAERVGYVSDASFCKAFKRAFGQSPGAYRRAARGASARAAA